MNYVFLGAFAAFSAVHLYASWKCDKILRAVTKVFLLPTLLGWYLTTVPNISRTSPSQLVATTAMTISSGV